MNEPVKMEGEADNIEEEDARIGYQVAVNLWIYQGKLNWDRFNVMLVACSIIAGLIGASFSFGQRYPAFAIGLAVLGLFLCLGWFLVMASGFDYHKYWGFCAWDLEERYLKGTVDTIAKLQAFRKDPVNFKGVGKKHARGPFSKISQRAIAYLVIALFTGVFIASIWMAAVLWTFDVL